MVSMARSSRSKKRIRRDSYHDLGAKRSLPDSSYPRPRSGRLPDRLATSKPPFYTTRVLTRRSRPVQAFKTSVVGPSSTSSSRILKKNFRASRGLVRAGVTVGDLPRAASVCVGRQKRREVLHALKKTGRVGQKRPKFTWKSRVKCRR